jgi:tetratricopeptide (TPR) repeat protein
VKGFRSLFLVPAVILLMAAPALSAGRIDDSLLDRGLRDDWPRAHLFIMEAERAEGQRRVELLKEAAGESPDMPVVYFKLSRAVLGPSPSAAFQSINYAVQGIKAYGRSFWWAMSLTGLLYVGLLLSLILSLLVVLLLRIPRELPLFVHDAAEKPRMLLLPAGLFALSLLGPLFFIACGLMIVGLYFRKTDKALVYGSLALIALSPFLLRVADMYLSAPSPETRAIAAVNTGTGNAYALQVLDGRRDFASRFSYALALKREGRVTEAISVLRELASGDSGGLDGPVLTNLGNAYFAAGWPTEAKEAYRQAVEAGPSVKTYYDMSQVYRDTLDFQSGDKYFLEAARLDRDRVTGFAAISSRNPNRFVIDETIPMAALWQYAYANRKEVMDPFTVAPWLAAILAVGLIAFFALLDARAGMAFRCSKCGRVMCQKCTPAIQWGQTCPECFNSLVRLVDVDPKDRVAKLLAVHEKKSKSRMITRMLSYALPGLSHIYAGRLIAGFVLLWMFLFAVAVIVLNPFFSTGLGPYSHSWLDPLLIIAAVVLYEVSRLSMRRRI